MESQTPSAKNTNAFFAQSAIAFGVAVFAMLVAIYYLPGESWPKAFLALGTLFLTTPRSPSPSACATPRRASTSSPGSTRPRVDRILAEHDPWKEVG